MTKLLTYELIQFDYQKNIQQAHLVSCVMSEASPDLCCCLSRFPCFYLRDFGDYTGLRPPLELKLILSQMANGTKASAAGLSGRACVTRMRPGEKGRSGASAEVRGA